MATKQMPTKTAPGASHTVVPGTGATKGKRAPARAAATRGKLKPRASAGRATNSDTPAGDQRARRGAADTTERYARLRIRVDDGGMTVVDSHVVDGPLVLAASLQGAYAYEVVLDGHLLHAGSVPDLGVMRSFAHPNGTAEQRGHHTYELKSYEFDARVPLAGMTRGLLAKAEVVLYRVKERDHGDDHDAPLHAAATLGAQRERQLREVGRVAGIPAAVLATRK